MKSQPVNITIPDTIKFADLRLQRDADGGVSFDWSPIEAICAASGVDPALFREAAEDNVSGLIVAWYQQHRAQGGEPDAVADDLIQEAALEAAAGSLSHAPGRA